MSIKKEKVYVSMALDTVEYQLPVDEKVEDEIKEQFESHIYDMDGVILNHIKVLVGE